MTSAEDRNDLVPAQEKLEWVTPKISLMDAEDTGAKLLATKEFPATKFAAAIGPS